MSIVAVELESKGVVYVGHDLYIAGNEVISCALLAEHPCNSPGACQAGAQVTHRVTCFMPAAVARGLAYREGCWHHLP